ncbi:MAG: hypothetical protein [Microvirus sp.]|nr:MAG: hypothetical protein [Microvirus sp.]
MRGRRMKSKHKGFASLHGGKRKRLKNYYASRGGIRL